MIKLQTGVSTDMDFIKAMKEKGQDVKAEFPAETLRRQFDEITENDITFNMTNEAFLEEVANGDEPGPTPPTPTDKVKITLYVAGVESADEPEARVGNEVITDFPVELEEDAGTELPITATCDGCKDYEGTLVFDENKEVDIVLEPVDITITFKLSSTFVTGDEPSVLIDGETVLDFPFEITKPRRDSLEYTASCEGYEPKTELVVFDRDKEVTINLIKAQVTEIEVTELPTKVNYEFGEELDLTGLEITGYHSDGTTEFIPISECSIFVSSDSSSSRYVNTVPKTTVYINWNSSFNASFEVNVTGGPVFQANLNKSLEEYTSEDDDLFFEDEELELYNRMIETLKLNENYEGKIDFSYNNETTEFTGVFKKIDSSNIECYVDGVKVLIIGENSAFKGIVFTENFHFINTSSNISLDIAAGDVIEIEDDGLYGKLRDTVDAYAGGEDSYTNIIVKTDKCYSGDYGMDSSDLTYYPGTNPQLKVIVDDDSDSVIYAASSN